MRFVVCGEALIDLMAVGSIDTFRSTWEALSAGGPLNTAIALARLGEEVQFAGRLSTDRFGQQLWAHLRANGVGLDLAIRTADATSLAVVSLDDEQKASYAFHFADTANFGWRAKELPALAADDWLHIASLSTVVPPGSQVLLPWADTHPGPISFDLNVRPTVIPDPVEYWSRIEPWLALCGRHRAVVKASDDDIDFLAAASGCAGEALDVMAEWCRLFGLATAVVTQGPKGAWAIGAGGETRAVPGRAVQVVDTVGAGDTFMAGLLAGYAESGDLTNAMHEAVAAAAYVCTRQGPQPPTRTELDAFLASASIVPPHA